MVIEHNCYEQGVDLGQQFSGPAIRKLTVSNFRNYNKLNIAPERGIIVLTGDNGAGKTNLLEALSMFSPGRGFRRARIADLDNNKLIDAAINGLNDSWAVSARIEVNGDQVLVGTGRQLTIEKGKAEKRALKINGYPAKSQTDLNEHITVSWLIPQMDRLFLDGGSQRRRFFDRLVFVFDALHSTRVNQYNHALRERRKLLQSFKRDSSWCLALEAQIAETGVAIVAARRDLIHRLSPIVEQRVGPFPGAMLSVDGIVERWLENDPALEVEEKLKEGLEEARLNNNKEPNDVPGPHRSEFSCIHSHKNTPADQCSTGEQKSLLISIMLAHAMVREQEFGNAPLILLDEVAAHLDELRRGGLFDLLGALKSQVWMTGTDISLFRTLGDKADFYNISDGNISLT